MPRHLEMQSATFQVKIITGTHTCPKVDHNNLAKARYLACKVQNIVRDNLDILIEKLKNTIQRKFNLNMST